MTSLDGRVDPSDLLILHEEVGTVQSANPARVCATTVMKITASNGKSVRIEECLLILFE